MHSKILNVKDRCDHDDLDDYSTKAKRALAEKLLRHAEEAIQAASVLNRRGGDVTAVRALLEKVLSPEERAAIDHGYAEKRVLDKLGPVGVEIGYATLAKRLDREMKAAALKSAIFRLIERGLVKQSYGASRKVANMFLARCEPGAT